jgi:LPS-assembly protein
MHWFRVAGLLALIFLLPPLAQAQDAPRRSVKGPQASMPNARLYMQADQLMFEAGGKRVVAQGNVELYWNNHILTADEVVYDQVANTLVAKGNAQLKDSNGNVTRADPFEAPADFRDAFAWSLRMTIEDYMRALAPPGRTDR